eukprot:Filipodium_phascolosomae@DN6808_c0_g1_i1.p2
MMLKASSLRLSQFLSPARCFNMSPERLDYMPREIIFAAARTAEGRTKGCIKLAKSRAMRQLRLAWTDRHKNKYKFRIQWIRRINWAAREYKMRYSSFMNCLNRANVHLNRKNLAILAETEPVSFKALVDEAKRIYYFPPTKTRDIQDL